MADYLLDTNTGIWLDQEVARVPSNVLRTLQSPDARLFMSTLALWEVVTKQTVGKLPEAVNLLRVMEFYRVRELVLDQRYLPTLRRLPLLHRDPFDRMMVAQAIVEDMVLVTGDRRLWDYPVPVLQV